MARLACAVLVLLAVVNTANAQFPDRRAQAGQIQSFFKFKHPSQNRELTVEEVEIALNRPTVYGGNMLDQGSILAGNAEALKKMQNGEWKTVPQIDAEKVFRFMFTAGGLELPHVDLNLAVDLSLNALTTEFWEARGAYNALKKFKSAMQPVNTAIDGFEIINMFAATTEGLRFNFVVNGAWSLGWDSPEALEFLGWQSGLISLYNTRNCDFVGSVLAMMERRAELERSLPASEARYRQNVQEVLTGRMDFNVWFDPGTAPGKLQMSAIRGGGPMGEAFVRKGTSSMESPMIRTRRPRCPSRGLRAIEV